MFLTKQLNIASGIAATLGNGNDVIELKVVLASALDTTASITLPNKHFDVIGDRLP